MQAISPSKPRLARFTAFGEMMYSESSALSGGRSSSIRCSASTEAAIDTVRHAVANTVVRRRDVIETSSNLESVSSFQVPSLENQDCAAESHSGIEKRVERVLQDQLRCDRLLVSHCADYIQRREIGHQIGSRSDEPPGNSVRQAGKAAEVIGKASNNE